MLLCIGQPFCFGRISFDEIIYTVVLNDTFHPLKVFIFTPKGFTGSDAHIAFHFYLFIVYITVTQWFHKYFSHCGNSAKKFKTKLTHFEKKY